MSRCRVDRYRPRIHTLSMCSFLIPLQTRRRVKDSAVHRLTDIVNARLAVNVTESVVATTRSSVEVKCVSNGGGRGRRL